MGLSSSYRIFIFLVLSSYQPSYCQQNYLNTSQMNCDPTGSKGYQCSGNPKPCQSFVTFRSRQPYDSPVSIARLLGSEAASIASINRVSIEDKISSDKLVVVPVSCSCSGSIYQHIAPYTIKKNDTYFKISTDIYQGLTSCQALLGQNYYDAMNLEIGGELTVPVRCACPSRNQIENGDIALLMYMVKEGDSVASIGNIFKVDEASIREANMLTTDSRINPFTPILVPLNSGSCRENPGDFFCQCPDGFLADGDTQGLNCKTDSNGFPVKLVTIIGVGIGVGLFCFFLMVFKLYKVLRQRRYRLHKERLFEQNGGLVLQQQLLRSGGGEKAKLFNAEELERATDNYNQSRFLGQGGFGTVYKGMLPDGSIVAVKRSRSIDRSQIEQFINEVVILSQINHRNIVRLIGCCLETDFPLLVYEFIPNGTLWHHIHDQDQESSLSWDDRLRIASEVAGAVAYMHSAASYPIFHRDIKSSNILLNDQYSSKVSDFGTSRSIQYDKSHLTTAVQGTFGYMDPEYFYTSQFTEKSDVYSFGVVLIELITGEKPISFDRREDERNLVAQFISSTMENCLPEILDKKVAREAKKEEIQSVAKLAIRCLRLSGKKRPTMKEVATELDGLRKSQRWLEIRHEPSTLRDEAFFLHEISEQAQDSIDEDVALSLELESV